MSDYTLLYVFVLVTAGLGIGYNYCRYNIKRILMDVLYVRIDITEEMKSDIVKLVFGELYDSYAIYKIYRENIKHGR